ncbi:MAG TPA: hypothetical protein VM490_10675, partial [Armatimonadaceae bacterium]|nr:hypothetical protein [Armatimonadaceae bacterium]
LGEQVPFSDKKKRFGDDEEAYATFARFSEHLGASGVPLADAKYRVGRKLTVDAKKEDFGRDRAANALLTREYRTPFSVPSRIA